MFSWGEDFQQGFRLKKGSAVPPAADGVQSLQLSFHVTDLCVGLRVLAFIKNSGEASIIRVSQNASGGREKRKQKFVKCEERLGAVSCTDDGVTLLSDKGVVFYVDSTHLPYTASPLEALKGIRVTRIACGSQHTLVLSNDGQVYTWGQNSRGQLGLEKDGSSISSPQHVRSLSSMPLVQVSAGGEQSFTVSVSGSVFGWGRNDCGQLGLGDTADRTTPTLIHYLNLKKTVFIACGKDHTAVLTTDGAVFTFGSGQHGQLGHNAFVDELRPRLVAELWGSKVTRIACGRYHTLALTDHRKVYSFGCNERGQLGQRQERHPCVPLHVQLLKGTTEGPKIQSIFAGGDSSFATCRPDQEMRSGLKSGLKQGAPVESLVDRWISEWDSKQHPIVKQEIHQRFSSASSLNGSFLNQRSHFQTSVTHSGVDLSLCKRVFEKLTRNEAIQSEVEKAVMEMLPCLPKNPAGVEGLRVFLILNELLYAMQTSRCVRSVEIAMTVAAAVQSLSSENLQTIANWWTLSVMESKSRHVTVWRTALSEVLRIGPASLSSVKHILQILQNMYNVNERKMKIPESTFCSEIDPSFLEVELYRWRSRLQDLDGNNAPLILCNFAFVMDVKTKQWVFQLNSNLTMAEHQPVMYDYFLGLPIPPSTYFELHLRRSSLVEDSFRQLAQAPPEHIRKCLVVYFDGDTKITQVYKKDFFHYLFPKIKTEKSEMFMTNDSETLAWFSIEDPEKIRTDVYVLGLLCGLALYNDCIFPVSFPLVLFKKLLGVKPTLEDLMEFCPVVGKSLQYVMNYEDDLEDLDMSFKIFWKDTDVDLDPENPGKPVTSQNKEEFVEAYVNYVFNTSVESVFQEFERGFFQLCDRNLLRMFKPEELQRLMVGQEDYDWAKLKQNTLYLPPWLPNGGQPFHADSPLQSPTMQMFWEVFDELTEDQRRDFLKFVTGSRKVPILGMDQIQMEVQLKSISTGSPDEHLPESLTCHNILQLPAYSSKEIMRDRLILALMAEKNVLNEEERPSL